MKTIHDYLRHAEECDLLAKTAVSEEQRQMIVKMAETWRLLAAQRERQKLAQAKIEAIDTGLMPPTGKRREDPVSQ
jgi:hypothetical protein